MDSGIRIRLKGDPGRVGVTTGRNRVRGDLTFWQIQFPDIAQYIPEDHLMCYPKALKIPLIFSLPVNLESNRPPTT